MSPIAIRSKEMCNKAVGSYPSAIQFVSDWYKTQEMCDKAIDTCFFVFDSVPDQYITFFNPNQSEAICFSSHFIFLQNFKY